MSLLDSVLTNAEANFGTHCKLYSHGHHIAESNNINDSDLSREVCHFHPPCENGEDFESPPFEALEQRSSHSLREEGAPASESFSIEESFGHRADLVFTTGDYVNFLTHVARDVGDVDGKGRSDVSHLKVVDKEPTPE